jgi:hypothetical protein
VDLIKVATSLFDGFPTSCVGDSGKVANGGGKFTSVNEFGIARGRSNMFLIAELAAAKKSM